MMRTVDHLRWVSALVELRNRLAVVFLLGLVLSWPAQPLVELLNATLGVEVATAQGDPTVQTEAQDPGRPDTTVETEIPPDLPPLDESILTDATHPLLQAYLEGVKRIFLLTEATRKLKLNAVDRDQIDLHLKLRTYLELHPEFNNGQGTISVANLPEEIREELNVDRKSEIDVRAIASLLNLVTPTEVGGAGAERLDVLRLTKDHRTEAGREETEVPPPPDEGPRESQHYRENGKAVDVSAKDYLRGTKFGIETEVDAATGKPILKDGKPVEEVVSIEHLPLEAIQFVWQTDEGVGDAKGADLLGQTPHDAAHRATENLTASRLREEGDRRGKEFGALPLRWVTNLAEAAKSLGRAARTDVLERDSLTFGRHAPHESGQQIMSRATGLHPLSFRTTSDNQTLDGTGGLLDMTGRAELGETLGVPGGIEGSSQPEILGNIGERFFEIELGDLPLGTLEHFEPGNRASLEVAVGRGVVAKFYDLWVSDLLAAGSTYAEFSSRLLTVAQELEAEPLLADNALGLSAGTTSLESWYQQIGQTRLRLLESYARKDEALNLTARPNLAEALKALPLATLDNPDLNPGITPSSREATQLRERAAWLLETFDYRDERREFLEQVAAGTYRTPSETRWLLEQTQLQGWLLDAAYAKGAPVDPKYVERFLAADRTVFEPAGLEYTTKRMVKDNDDRSALRTYLGTGVMPKAPKTALPMVDLDAIGGSLGLGGASNLALIFNPTLNTKETPTSPLVFESLGRIQLLGGLKRDPAAAVTRTSVDEATIRDRLEAVRTAGSAVRGYLGGDERGFLDESLHAVDDLIDVVDDAAVLEDARTSRDWLEGLSQLYESGSLLARVTPDANLDEYRGFALAVAELTQGNAGHALYDLSKVDIGLPIGNLAIDQFSTMLNEDRSPNETIRAIGGFGLDQLSGLEPGTSGFLYDLLDAATTDPTPPSREELRDALAGFAFDHSAELAELAGSLELDSFGFRIDGTRIEREPGDFEGVIGQDRMAEAMVHLMLEPSAADIARGAAVFDEAQGFAGYEVGERGQTGSYGALTEYSGDAIEQVLDEMEGNSFLFEAITGRLNVGLSKKEQENKFLAAGIRIVADKAGLPITPDMILDPDYEWKVEEGIFLVESLTGQKFDQAVRDLDIPIVGDFLADRAVITAAVKSIFAGDHKFWDDQKYLPRLQQMAFSAGFPEGVPAIKALFDNKLTDKQREKAWDATIKLTVRNRLTPSVLNDLFGLEDTEAAFTAEGIAGIVDVLLDDEKPDKWEAVKEFGGDLADRYVQSKYGYSIKWMWDEKLKDTEKGRIGLRTISQALELDPTLFTLADTFYEVFLIDGGLAEADTVEGRAQRAKLTLAIGAAAGVPDEYTVIAASALTGDLETTLVSFAGQRFVDTQLREFGILDVGFADIYEAYVGLLPTTRQRIWDESVFELESFKDQYGDELMDSFDDTGQPKPLVEIEVPGGEPWKVREYERDFVETAQQKKREEIGKEKRKTVQYALGDAVLHKALGEDAVPGSLRGFTKAMLEGDADEKVKSFGGLLAQLSNSENADLIFFGTQTALDLKNFFSSDEKDLGKVSEDTWVSLDAWIAQSTGWDIPVGVSGSVLAAIKTGTLDQDAVAPDGKVLAVSFSNLLKSDYTQMKLGGYLDTAIGLPSGTAYTAWKAYEDITKANTLVQAARATEMSAKAGVARTLAADQRLNPGAFAGGQLVGTPSFAHAQALQKAEVAQETLLKAEQQLGLTTAGYVTMGVNLLFGSTFAKLDGQLGLPSGTISLIVSAAIYFLLVPGITFAVMATALLVPAIGVLAGLLGLGGDGGPLGFLGIGGKKKKTKKVNRVEILWSFHRSDPTTQPATTKTQATGKGKTKFNTSKPPTELDRGDWPEEAWYQHPYEVASSPDKPIIYHPGVEIAFEPDKKLPAGIFRGNSKEQFQAGIRFAANSKLVEFIGDLVTLPERFPSELAGDNLPQLLPRQIWTHQLDHLEANRSLIECAYALDGACQVGELDKLIVNDTQRFGVGYDEEVPLHTRHVHWQY